MKRAMKSDPPPGAKGTTMRTGLAGYAWAPTVIATAERAKARIVRTK
jgi:hypothetical protein